MRYKISLLIIGAAGVVLLWCTSSSQRPERGEPEVLAVAPEEMHRAEDQAAPGRAPVAVTDPASRPELPVTRVDFDRRPWNPREELDTHYRRRAKVFEGFDRFLEDTGMSDERAQELLMILYDYQENLIAIEREIDRDLRRGDKWELEWRLHATTPLRIEAGMEAYDRVRAMLSPDERRAWKRRMDDRRTQIWATLLIQAVTYERVILPVAPGASSPGQADKRGP